MRTMEAGIYSIVMLAQDDFDELVELAELVETFRLCSCRLADYVEALAEGGRELSFFTRRVVGQITRDSQHREPSRVAERLLHCAAIRIALETLLHELELIRNS